MRTRISEMHDDGADCRREAKRLSWQRRIIVRSGAIAPARDYNEKPSAQEINHLRNCRRRLFNIGLRMYQRIAATPAHPVDSDRVLHFNSKRNDDIRGSRRG